ncbi:hypothetical protein AB0C98_08580 [Streptomyces sp. NPDC048558]
MRSPPGDGLAVELDDRGEPVVLLLLVISVLERRQETRLRVGHGGPGHG